MKKVMTQLHKSVADATAPSHWLNAFGKPRNTRNPCDYVKKLLNGVVRNICLLQADGSKDCCPAEEMQRTARGLFDPVQRLIDQGEATGESLELEADKKRSASAVDPAERAQIVYAYCHEAELAYNSGDVTAAWTLIVDAMRVAAALRAPIVYLAGGVFRTSIGGKKAGEARHAKYGHATPETKEKVHQLWREWIAGKHQDWKTQAAFAEGCQEYLDGGRVSDLTILKKWIRAWKKEEQAKK